MNDPRTIHFAEGLDLPVDVATQKFAFMGITGSGKTHAAGVLVEALLLEVAAQVVVLDPVGIWWGLRLLADGKRPGIPIIVLGGEHGDAPLDPDSGALIANLVVDRRWSVVLDVSEFSLGEQRRFMTAFGEEFFQKKKAQRSAVHVVLEEAQEFLPQFAGKGEERMLAAWTRIWKLGRNYGIGGSIVTQRPQEVAKKALNQSGVLVVLRTIGKQEKKAIREWIVETEAGASTEGLEKLETGTACVWSPAWLRVLGVFKVARKRTFDSHATPDVGSVVGEAKPFELPAREHIQAALGAAVKHAEDNDPALLQKRIAKLERELATVRADLEFAKAQPTPAPVTRAILLPGLLDEGRHLQHEVSLVLDSFAKVRDGAEALVERMEHAELAEAAAHMQASPLGFTPPSRPAEPKPRRTDLVVPTGGARTNGDAKLGRCELAILAVAAWRKTSTQTQVAVFSGYRQSGGFRNALGRLRSLGYIVGGRDDIRITPAGRDHSLAGPPPRPGRDLLSYWVGQLEKCEREILQDLAEHGPAASKEALAKRTSYQVSGGFRNALGKLRTMELIEGYGPITASPLLVEGSR